MNFLIHKIGLGLLGGLVIIPSGCKAAEPKGSVNTETITRGRSLLVSSRATQQGDGSLKRPFRTIQEAASVAKPGDTVLVRAGTYRETVVPSNSGTASASITYRPYQNEVVTVSGADSIVNWKKQEGEVYRASMASDFYRSATNQSDQVFVNGQMVNLARWPNTSLDVSYPKKSTITKFITKTRADNWSTATFEDDNLSPQTDDYYVGAEVVIQPNKDAWSWTLSGTVVDQKGKQLTIRSRSNSGVDGDSSRYAVGSRYYLHNKRELLDQRGEWFHDLNQSALLLQTPSGANPNGLKVEAKRRDYAFNLDGKSYINVEGFNLFACSITTDNQAGNGVEWDAKGNDLYPWRPKGTLATANHIVLDGLNVKYPSHFTDMSGHFYLQWGQNTGLVLSGSDHIVRNCTVQYSAGHGIVTLGQRNKILNNLVLDTSYQQVDAAAISTGGAADSFDHEIAFNTVKRCGRSGILPRNLRNSDATNLRARIHHNDISEVMLQDHDGGAIYATADGNWTRIDHNWCHDINGFTASGVYPDLLTNWIIDHNLIWNLEWGIHLQQQPDSPKEVNALVYNNTILVKNTSGVPYGPFGFANSNGRSTGSVIRNNLVACVNPAQSPGYKPISGNFDDAEMGENLFSTLPALGLSSAAQPLSVLEPNSPARDAGKVIPSYTRGGVTVPAFNDPVSGDAPDLGAYELGQPAWRAGSVAVKRK